MSSGFPTDWAGGDRVGAIAAILQENILTGHYGPGDRLPSEAELCAHFNVSRPTVREALGRLVAGGLIRSRRGAGGGAFVTRPEGAQFVPQIAAMLGLSALATTEGRTAMLTEARIQLLTGCAQLAALRHAEITDIRTEIDRQSDFTIADEDYAASCRRMYLMLCAASGNPVLELMSQALVEAEAGMARGRAYPTRVRARYLSYHVRLANAIGAGRPDDAVGALTELWQYELESLEEDAQQAEPTPEIVERPPRMRDLRRPPVQRLTGRGE